MPSGGRTPHHWKTTAVTAGLRASGIIAPWLLDGAMNGQAFRTYVADVLSPTLRPGDTVVLDNLPAHKVSGIRERIEVAGAQLFYLPAYSPDFNPIEMAKSTSGFPSSFSRRSVGGRQNGARLRASHRRRRG
jgi:transposase